MDAETPSAIVYALISVAFTAMAVAILVLRPKVPRRGSAQSPDDFWAHAATPALVLWAPLEGAGLLGLVAYAMSGSPVVLAVPFMAILALLVYRPGALEGS